MIMKTKVMNELKELYQNCPDTKRHMYDRDKPYGSSN